MAKSNIFEPFILVSPMLDENSNRNSYKDCIKFFQNNCDCVELGYDDNIKSYIDIKNLSQILYFFSNLGNYIISKIQNMLVNLLLFIIFHMLFATLQIL